MAMGEERFCLVQAVSRLVGVDEFDLYLQARLHAPVLSPDWTLNELAELANRRGRISDFSPEFMPRSLPGRVSDLRFGVVSDRLAESIHRNVHYLRSARALSQHFGLSTATGAICALASVSPLDDPNMMSALSENSAIPDSSLVVSRVFVFRWAPRNCISYLLGKVANYLRANLRSIELLTYVNPNLGFSGASYRAANWRLVGVDARTEFVYINGLYHSTRQLRERFGARALADVASDNDVVHVTNGLDPLLIPAHGTRRDKPGRVAA